ADVDGVFLELRVQRPAGVGHAGSLVVPGQSSLFCADTHTCLPAGHPRFPRVGTPSKTWITGTNGTKSALPLGPAMTATNAFRRFCTSPAKPAPGACFPALLAPNR